MWHETNSIYDGDWEKSMRHGFGTFNVLQGGQHVKQYAGGWKNDNKHVSMSIVGVCV